MKGPSALSHLCALLMLCASQAIGASALKSDEEIIYFPTNATWSEQDKGWRLAVHGWVFEAERDSLWRNGTLALLKQQLELPPHSNHSQHLQQRGWPFIVDNERNKRISVRIAEREYPLLPSQANGHFYDDLMVDENLTVTANNSPWLGFETVMPEGDARRFRGRVQLISEQGLSVISDIDDTIKLSNVLDKEELLQNTFLHDFQSIPGMAELYQGWSKQGAVFHYVTGSPWQLYPSLSEFIVNYDFPRGSFNMRNFRIKDASLFDFLGSSYDYKITTIDKLIQRYPQRHFILVGDSGEKDPEVYGEIARRHPKQIAAIYIHNVTGESATAQRYQSSFNEYPDKKWKLFNHSKEIEQELSELIPSQ